MKERTFEGTLKGTPFVVNTKLSNEEAVNALREMGRDFASDCADQIEIMGMRENLPASARKKLRVRQNLVAWGFRLVEDAFNRVVVMLNPSIVEQVKFRRPFHGQTSDGYDVTVRVGGPNSKRPGTYAITNGLNFYDPEQRFYGYATAEGEWTPTKDTPESVIKLLTE